MDLFKRCHDIKIAQNTKRAVFVPQSHVATVFNQMINNRSWYAIFPN